MSTSAEIQPCWDVLVAGGGAAGLMASISAAEAGARVLVLEKNARPGVKILMSGGSRCNITHHCDNRGIVSAYGKKGKFLHSPLASFSTRDTISFFESEGVATKVEETGKVFPVSNKASDVLQALIQRAERAGVILRCLEPVRNIQAAPNQFHVITPNGSHSASTFILTTGGLSFPRCGTTGDGFEFASRLGHSIVPTRPALVPLALGDPWVKDLAGITTPDVCLTLSKRTQAGKGERIGTTRGSMLFTHVGITGPCPLNLTRLMADWNHPEGLALEADFSPERSHEQMNDWIILSARENGKRSLASLLSDPLPRRLVDSLIGQENSLNCKLSELSKSQRAHAVSAIKTKPLTILGNLGYAKAEVTSGGVALEEVDFKTMQSRIQPRLFLAGEVLDLDGPIGGFNFQAAWSTGWLAGIHAARVAKTNR